MKYKFLIVVIFSSIFGFSQDVNFKINDLTINEHVDGTLLTPSDNASSNLVIIIAGSGPTDRNGNQNFLNNNSLKKLAQGLSNKGIATFRYDKRIVKQIKNRNIDDNIMFDDFVTDARSVVNYFKSENQYSKIYIAGHSQGSLVGMLAASEGIDGFISLAGAGNSIDDVIIDQINSTSPQFTNDAKRIFSILKEGKTTNDYPAPLASLFDKSIQPFMSNWIQYNPKEEIKKLDIPVLIINGTKDLQVSVDEANLLKEAKPEAKLVIIDNMNHVLVPISSNDTLENSKSYNEPRRELSPQLIEAILNFIE